MCDKKKYEKVSITNLDYLCNDCIKTVSYIFLQFKSNL